MSADVCGHLGSLPLPHPLLPSRPVPSLLQINAKVLAPTPTRARAPIIRKAAGEAGKCSPLPPSFSLSLSLSGSVELSLDVWMGYLSHRQATRGHGEIGSSCSVSCGVGHQTRFIEVSPKNGGLQCTGSRRKGCQLRNCPGTKYLN